jgi:membrane-associated phospholipid phosphatase
MKEFITVKHVKITAFNANKTGLEQGMIVVANAISLSFLAALLLPMVAYTQTADVFYLYLPTGIVVANIAVDGTKRVLGSVGVFGRPAGATGCDLFCISGPVGGQPGFPSGHVTTATMFVAALWLHTCELWVLVIGIPWIVAMAWARWYKHCHNVPQIVGGLVAGCIGAAIVTGLQ